MAGALLLVDFQRDFLDAKGRKPVAQPQVPDLIAAANSLIEAARQRGDVIVAIGNEFHPMDPLNLFRNGAAIAGSEGARWDEHVAIPDAAYFPKWRGDAFCNPALERFLREKEVDSLTIAGVYASQCVSATTKGALRRGFRVALVPAAVADANDRRRRAALDGLRRLGAAVAP